MALQRLLLLVLVVVGSARAQVSDAAECLEGIPLDNVNYVGRGYDFLSGNPHDSSGSGDPGWRDDIFQTDASLSDSEVTLIGDQPYIVSSGVDATSCATCSLEATSTEILTANSYRDSLRTYVKASGSVGGFSPLPWNFAMKASTEYQSVHESYYENEHFFLESTARCEVYCARLRENTLPPFTPSFAKAVENLPIDMSGAFALSDMINFADSFGTHYASDLVFGATYGFRFEMSRTNIETLDSLEIDYKVAAKASVAFGLGGKQSASTEGSNEQEVYETYQSNIQSDTLISYGGSPPSVEDGVLQTEDWVNNLDSPLPLTYSINEIADLLTTENFPNDTNIEAKQLNLYNFMVDYCNARRGQGNNNLRCDDLTDVDFGSIVLPLFGTSDVLLGGGSGGNAFDDSLLGFSEEPEIDFACSVGSTKQDCDSDGDSRTVPIDVGPLTAIDIHWNKGVPCANFGGLEHRLGYGDACCAPHCDVCGGSGCDDDDDKEDCCRNHIDSSRTCDHDTGAPCLQDVGDEVQNADLVGLQAIYGTRASPLHGYIGKNVYRLEISQSQPITTVSVWRNSRVRGLQFHYSSGSEPSPLFGQKSSPEEDLVESKILIGEPILYMKGRSGAQIHQLTFVVQTRSVKEEVCQGVAEELGCPRFKRMHITSSSYGRMESSTCIGTIDDDTRCSDDVTAEVAGLCQGQQSCTLDETYNNLFDAEALGCSSNGEQYLAVEYDCLDSDDEVFDTASRTVLVVAAEEDASTMDTSSLAAGAGGAIGAGGLLLGGLSIFKKRRKTPAPRQTSSGNENM